MEFKKYFIVFILVFSGFISTQFIWDMSHLKAEHSTLEQAKSIQFEGVLKKLNMESIESEKINLQKITQPLVVLNFWASWCLPCLKEFPSLVAFQNKFSKDALVIAINGDEENPKEAIQKISKKYQLNFKHVIDDKSLIGDKFEVNTYPSSFVFHKGKLIYYGHKSTDFMDKKFLELIEKSLKN